MRNLPLDRTNAEALVDLLEDCDMNEVGIWRQILAEDIRELFAMKPNEQRTAQMKAITDRMERQQ
jgi:hypothetical protein